MTFLFQPQQTILTLFKPLQRGIATCMTCQNTKVQYMSAVSKMYWFLSSSFHLKRQVLNVLINSNGFDMNFILRHDAEATQTFSI